ncbi:cysteine hydrolase family protein [Halalkalibacter sp. AB-rgal2]|uniref:cysteine hydrolase family protein n=1 Tax=Halalkalibacter sp. AB-rgal2 TaxID=3242695 RepID=UPI00359DCA33
MYSKKKQALLIIDMINDFEFKHGEQLIPYAMRAAHTIKSMKEQLKSERIPIIYVNDNYGRWQSDFRHIVSHCAEQPVRGQPIAKLLQPEQDDYFILKPQYSGFFCTPLHLLLDHLSIQSLILTGVTADMCVQFTANDGYMRGYDLHIPADAVASQTNSRNDHALELMKHVLKADISQWSSSYTSK